MAAPTGQTHDCIRPQSQHANLALDAGAPSTHDPEEKFLPFTFRPETGPTIRTFALCLVLHYENALPLRISARIGSSN